MYRGRYAMYSYPMSGPNVRPQYPIFLNRSPAPAPAREKPMNMSARVVCKTDPATGLRVCQTVATMKKR